MNRSTGYTITHQNEETGAEYSPKIHVFRPQIVSYRMQVVAQGIGMSPQKIGRGAEECLDVTTITADMPKNGNTLNKDDFSDWGRVLLQAANRENSGETLLDMIGIGIGASAIAACVAQLPKSENPKIGNILLIDPQAGNPKINYLQSYGALLGAIPAGENSRTIITTLHGSLSAIKVDEYLQSHANGFREIEHLIIPRYAIKNQYSLSEQSLEELSPLKKPNLNPSPKTKLFLGAKKLWENITQ